MLSNSWAKPTFSIALTTSLFPITGILDKLKSLLDKIPIVGKSDVVKAMENVGLAHELLNKIGKQLK